MGEIKINLFFWGKRLDENITSNEQFAFLGVIEQIMIILSSDVKTIIFCHTESQDTIALLCLVPGKHVPVVL